MSTISVRLPNSLHKTARDLAKRDNISINQFIALALSEKISALITDEYLKERAERGNRDAFEKALSKVADVEPDEADRLAQHE